jgi:hypothetical protein
MISVSSRLPVIQPAATCLTHSQSFTRIAWAKNISPLVITPLFLADFGKVSRQCI